MPKRKIRIVIVILSLGLLGLGAFSNFARKNYVLPILMYHSINPQAVPENRLAVTPQAFQRQMAFLSRNYNVVSLDYAAELIREKKKIPPRTVAITFDDGYRDNYTYAFPILKKYNLPAVIFIITSEVGRAGGDRLSWDEIKSMQSSGLITFGSHTLGPEPMVNISSEEELIRQIFGSKKVLKEKLGVEITAFSYPEGRFNEKIKNLVKAAGYKVAVITSPGWEFPNDDVFALKRLRISSTSDNLPVFWIETSGMYTFIKEHRDEP